MKLTDAQKLARAWARQTAKAVRAEKAADEAEAQLTEMLAATNDKRAKVGRPSLSIVWLQEVVAEIDAESFAAGMTRDHKGYPCFPRARSAGKEALAACAEGEVVQMFGKLAQMLGAEATPSQQDLPLT